MKKNGKQRREWKIFRNVTSDQLAQLDAEGWDWAGRGCHMQFDDKGNLHIVATRLVKDEAVVETTGAGAGGAMLTGLMPYPKPMEQKNDVKNLIVVDADAVIKKADEDVHAVMIKKFREVYTERRDGVDVTFPSLEKAGA